MTVRLGRVKKGPARFTFSLISQSGAKEKVYTFAVEKEYIAKEWSRVVNLAIEKAAGGIPVAFDAPRAQLSRKESIAIAQRVIAEREREYLARSAAAVTAPVAPPAGSPVATASPSLDANALDAILESIREERREQRAGGVFDGFEPSEPQHRWAIDNHLSPVPVDAARPLYSQDAYLILVTGEAGRELHVWVGKGATPAASSAAAFSALALCKALANGGGAPRQFRSEQGAEEAALVAALGDVEAVPGSALEHPATVLRRGRATALSFYRLQSRSDSRVLLRELVPCAAELPVSPSEHQIGHYFLVTVPSTGQGTVYCWWPSGVRVPTPDERAVALEVSQLLRNVARGGDVQLCGVLGDDETTQEMLKHLEKSTEKPIGAVDETIDEVASDDTLPVLHRVSFGKKGIKSVEVAKGRASLSVSMLDPASVFFLVYDALLYVWCGRQAHSIHCAAAVRAAETVIGPEQGLETVVVKHNCEPPPFAVCFRDWCPLFSVPERVAVMKKVVETRVGDFKAIDARAYALCQDELPTVSAALDVPPADDDVILIPRTEYHLKGSSTVVQPEPTGIFFSTDCHAVLAQEASGKMRLYLWQGRYSSPASTAAFLLEITKEVRVRLAASGEAAPSPIYVAEGAEPSEFLRMFAEDAALGALVVRAVGSSRKFLPLKVPSFSDKRLRAGTVVLRVSGGVARESAVPLLHSCGVYVIVREDSLAPLVWVGAASDEDDEVTARTVAEWFSDDLEDEYDDDEEYSDDEGLVEVRHEARGDRVPRGFVVTSLELDHDPVLLLARAAGAALEWVKQNGVPSQQAVEEAQGAILDAGNCLYVVTDRTPWMFVEQIMDTATRLSSACGPGRIGRRLPIQSVVAGAEPDGFLACFSRWLFTAERRAVDVNVGSAAEWLDGDKNEFLQTQAEKAKEEGVLIRQRVEDPEDWDEEPEEPAKVTLPPFGSNVTLPAFT